MQVAYEQYFSFSSFFSETDFARDTDPACRAAACLRLRWPIAHAHRGRFLLACEEMCVATFDSPYLRDIGACPPLHWPAVLFAQKVI
jgi:hypothetical protein